MNTCTMYVTASGLGSCIPFDLYCPSVRQIKTRCLWPQCLNQTANECNFSPPNARHWFYLLWLKCPWFHWPGLRQVIVSFFKKHLRGINSLQDKLLFLSYKNSIYETLLVYVYFSTPPLFIGDAWAKRSHINQISGSVISEREVAIGSQYTKTSKFDTKFGRLRDLSLVINNWINVHVRPQAR